ncbi:MAG: KpsF/GutQ family sugar-phosphate isomerase [Pirellulales bacterium]|nr:KpsF/GutQ family sugar-phosphate isomerase [Pirellulales bacterium]
MSAPVPRISSPLAPHEQLLAARHILAREAEALELLSARLDTEFCRAADLLAMCEGNLLLCGIGKAGLIAQKLTATFSSTGTPAHFLHPAEAIHGDLGRVRRSDVVLILSQSGETEEITRILPPLRELGPPLVAMTARRTSSLGKAAAITLELGKLQEACPLGLAPSTSTTAMLGLGDALALVVSQMRGFDQRDFARLHPGGALGRKLAKVEDVMRPLGECRLSSCGLTVRQVLATARMPRRRTGAIMIVDPHGVLRGIFTDSDLARLFETHNDRQLDLPIRQVMTKHPRQVTLGMPLSSALEILAERKISELPVVDAEQRPVGLIDITDVLGMFEERGPLRAAVVTGSAEAAGASTITSPIPISAPSDIGQGNGLHTEEWIISQVEPGMPDMQRPPTGTWIAAGWPEDQNASAGMIYPVGQALADIPAGASPPTVTSNAIPRPNSSAFFGPARTPPRTHA